MTRHQRTMGFVVLLAALAVCIAYLRFESPRQTVGLELNPPHPASEEDSSTELPSPTQGLSVEHSSREEQRSLAAGPSSGITEIAVQVRRDDGRVVPQAVVTMVDARIMKFKCDDQGRVLIPTEPGSHEIWVERSGEVLCLYLPNGNSDARVDVEAGTRARVDLVVYRPARLSCEFVDSTGEVASVSGVSLSKLVDDQWEVQSSDSVTLHGRLEFTQLEGGVYRVAPGLRTLHWIEPRDVELLVGETKNITLVCSQPRPVPITIRTRASAGGPPLPIRLEARTSPRQEPGFTLPPQLASAVVFAEDGAELELQLLPGLTDVTFHSTQQVGNCTQILRQYTWTREIDLREDGVPVPSEFELIADSIGQVAVVRGRLIGARRIATYGIAYTLPGGEERSAALRCDPQDKTFQLIVDISLVAGGAIEFTEFRAGDWEVRARHVLKPGDQTWTIDL